MSWLEEETAILEEVKIVIRKDLYAAWEACNAGNDAICDTEPKVAIPPELAAMWQRDSAKTEWALSQIIVWDPDATESEVSRASKYYRTLGGGAARILGFIGLISSPDRLYASLRAIERLQQPVESGLMIQYICDVSWVLRALQARDTSLLAYSIHHVLDAQSTSLPEAYRLLSPADRTVMRPVIAGAVPRLAYELSRVDDSPSQ